MPEISSSHCGAFSSATRCRAFARGSASGAAAAFDAEGAACPRLTGRFAYVLTLDADTRLLPEEARRLIGAMAHPLNRD
jgi:hypothetical protein